MIRRHFQIGGLLAALVLAAGLATSGIAATPKHQPGSGLAAKKDVPKKDAPKKDEPPINAPHAILIDAENGGVLFERDPNKLIFPASLGKLMTVEYVFHELKEGRLKLSDEFPVSENAWRKGGAPSHSSTMYAALNSRVKVEDLVRGMIVQSGNDACIVLAEGIAGTEAEFATKLTQHQFERPARSRREGHDARTRTARALHHP
jgi:D-alanyl-D-alanine carboxypeptidase (penicillin-binding protein 5/6)